MPKLSKAEMDGNRRSIESAALQLFVKQGFHGTSIRDIADASGASIGNLYNYYRSKEELYLAIVEAYEHKVQHLFAQALRDVDNVFEPHGLKDLARRICKIVYAEPDYWRLMYIDVTEFGNEHFAHSFRNLSENLSKLLGKKLSAPKAQWKLKGVDPALAFTAIYLQFFTYFLVEKLFGGKQHLGVDDEEAIRQMVTMYTRGLSGGPNTPKTKSAKAGGRS
jgi:AcrR family transcriptional regulator